MKFGLNANYYQFTANRMSFAAILLERRLNVVGRKELRDALLWQI